MSVSPLIFPAKAAQLPAGVLAAAVTSFVLAVVLPTEYSSPQLLYRELLPAKSVEMVACVVSLCLYRPVSHRVWDTLTLRSPRTMRCCLRLAAAFTGLVCTGVFMLLDDGGHNRGAVLVGWRSCLTYLLLAALASDLPALSNIGPAFPAAYFVFSSLVAYGADGHISLWAFTRAGNELRAWLPLVGLAAVVVWTTCQDRKASNGHAGRRHHR